MTEITRRGFVGGAAAVAGAALVASPALADEAPAGFAIPRDFTAEDIANSSVELEPITEFAAEETYDIVVVGAGCAGVPAALTAIEEGASVGVLQREEDAQANGMGYAPKWFGVDGMDGILTMEGFDTSLAEGVMLLTPFNADSTDERTQNFVKKYQEQFGEVPNQFAADAYDCVYAYKQALENAGATPDMSAEDLCAAMIEQFTSMTFDGLTGDGMTWDATGAVSKSPKGMVIENGAYVGLD